MGNRIKSIFITSAMVLSLVLTACSGATPTSSTSTPASSASTSTPSTPATTSTQPTTNAPTPTTAPAQGSQQNSLTPTYGGTLVYRITGDPTNFDSATQPTGGALLGTVYQQFLNSDWTRGPAGSGVTDFAAGAGSIEDSEGPEIAESWSMPSLGVWVLQIRQGVHWQPVNSDAGRLMGGRELTADDIVAGFNYLFNRDGKSPNSWIVRGQPKVAQTATMEKTGPWEVTIKTPAEIMTAFTWVIQGAGFYRVYPPQVIAKYGNLADWHNAVGTGPYMLVDYVPGSQLRYQKNPNYWETDPVGPGKGNKLPYIDTIQELIIPDLSTAFAALRTGKLALQGGVTLTDAQTMWKTAPDIKYSKYVNGMYGIGMAQENPANPYHDLRVRQALMYATDFEAIKNDYYSGEAVVINWPANPNLLFYEPMDKLPKAVQDLYTYNPDKAKQLLKDAGYPDGFKVNIVVQSNSQRIDELSIIKDMWAKVGVNVNLDIKESGAYNSMVGAGVPYPEMLYRVFPGSYFNMHLYQAFTRGTAILNISHINNPPGTIPYLEDLFNDQDKNLFVNMQQVYDDVKKVDEYVMEQAYVIPLPLPYIYSFWWPWLENNYG